MRYLFYERQRKMKRRIPQRNKKIINRRSWIKWPFLWLIILTAGLRFPQMTSAGEKEIHIVTTIFPEYDWMRQVLGNRTEDAALTLLLDNGVDSHSFQPTVEDIITVSSCDLFVYVGGESDSWVADALSEAVNPDMKVLNLLELLGEGAHEEETVEGMQPERGEKSGDDSEEAGEEDREFDEHVWLSLRNAELFCRAFAEILGETDPEHAEEYRENADAYIDKLAALDQEYEKTVSGTSDPVLLFGDRFPFLYLTEDYGISYYAAFAGCSAEAEASFETIAFLADKLKELGLPAVLVIEGSDCKLAETIRDSAGDPEVQILTLDSMQSVTSQDVEEGRTYLSVMEENLKVLKQALS